MDVDRNFLEKRIIILYSLYFESIPFFKVASNDKSYKRV
jgi:hypothetical protein